MRLVSEYPGNTAAGMEDFGFALQSDWLSWLLHVLGGALDPSSEFFLLFSEELDHVL